MPREREKEEKECSMDVNIYATRKTVAQGMMDIALLTANAAQLKHVLAAGDAHDYYLISLVLIGTSLTLQVLVGILLVVVGRWNINLRKQQHVANTTNNIIVILIFFITVINVLITAFDDDDHVIEGSWTGGSHQDPLLESKHVDRGLKMVANTSETIHHRQILSSE